MKINEPLHLNKIFSNCMNSMQALYYFGFIHWLEAVANGNCAVGVVHGTQGVLVLPAV